MAWRTWSYTIAGGFRAVPSLCKQLGSNRLAYSDGFYAAVTNAWLTASDQAGSWIRICPG